VARLSRSRLQAYPFKGRLLTPAKTLYFQRLKLLLYIQKSYHDNMTEKLITIGKRKITKFGGSYVIGLPKEFAKINGWTAGREVVLKSDGVRLVIELLAE